MTVVDDALGTALASAAAAGRLLVAVDFDGTLAPIVADPEAARALPGGLEALEELATLDGTTVVLVSGRSRDALARLAPTSASVRTIGSHGAESDAFVLSPRDEDRLRTVLAAVHAVADGVAGVLLERKPAGIAVHVRNASRDDAARVSRAVLDGPATLEGVHVTRGKEVVELSVLDATKGAAVDALRAAVSADRVLYLGDDVTDETVFGALGPDDVGVKVGDGPSAASHRVAGPEDVVRLLQRLLADRRATSERGGAA
ncbi:MAG: trehalose-phosphatase [Frankiales bacterium]|nr:trehalose-phosphatase [Frankiales bacterium]